MPYQYRQINDESRDADEHTSFVFPAQNQPNDTGIMQVLIVFGLIIAILVAVFNIY